MKPFEVSSRKVLSDSEYFILRENDRIYELAFKISANGRMLVLAEESLMVEVSPNKWQHKAKKIGKRKCKEIVEFVNQHYPIK